MSGNAPRLGFATVVIIADKNLFSAGISNTTDRPTGPDMFSTAIPHEFILNGLRETGRYVEADRICQWGFESGGLIGIYMWAIEWDYPHLPNSQTGEIEMSPFQIAAIWCQLDEKSVNVGCQQIVCRSNCHSQHSQLEMGENAMLDKMISPQTTLFVCSLQLVPSGFKYCQNRLKRLPRRYASVWVVLYLEEDSNSVGMVIVGALRCSH